MELLLTLLIYEAMKACINLHQGEDRKAQIDRIRRTIEIFSTHVIT
jgi:hypothetical protein